MKRGSSLVRLRNALERASRSRAGARIPHFVPALWLDHTAEPGVVDVDPFVFHRNSLEAILATDPAPFDRAGRGGDWCREAVVYNLFIRLACAWDHDGDGGLGLPLGRGGWRETGTFLKAIAVLPYIRSLGADTVHLLPVQEIGSDGRRGSLGSPYAVRDPRAIDPMLGEPATGLNAGEQFDAFVEAAHRLGLRVVLELPLRTMSKDCVWAESHPDWFYWIPADVEFHPPAFPPDQVRAAGDLVAAGRYDELPHPPDRYRDLFRDQPGVSTIRLEHGRWVGRSGGGGAMVIPGAFADWPPDDHQPVWGDITYLKFHQDGRYNYPAYNTVRMYPSNLLESGTETRDLWSELVDLVRWYAAEFRIDGLMVDMAHALPEGLARMIISGARSVNPGFAFWAEDFSRTPEQVKTGYDAVLGGQWACQHRRADFADMLSWLGRTPDLLPHLAAPETHNTPRAASRPGGRGYASYAWTVSCFIPGIPFIHSGLELNETAPVNTGLGFTPEDLERFPADVLPLFSAASLRWDGSASMLTVVRKSLALRRRFLDCVAARNATFRLVGGGDDRVLAFARSSGDGRRSILVAANSDPETPVRFGIGELPPAIRATDLFTGTVYDAGDGTLRGPLGPGQVALFSTDEV